jgi:PKD repeat protein
VPLSTDRLDLETRSTRRPTLNTVVAACGVLFAAACGEGSDLLLLPGDGQPVSIRSENDGQSGRVGEPLADSVSFVVSDSRLRPVNGAQIVFDLSSAPGAEVVPDTAETNADGRAAVRLVLGTTIGPQVGQARVVMPDGSPGPTTNFTSIGLSENANGIIALSGDDQTAPAGTALSQPLVIQVSDAFGNPIAGVPISWAAEGGGSVSEAFNQTDADGRASVQRTLGPTAGIQTTMATSEGLAGSPVTFTHTATAGSAAGLSIVSGNEQTGQAGTELPGDLVVRLVDAAGNGVPGAAVTWVVGTGGGRVSPENTVTDEAGRTSSRLTLGPNPGENRVDAVVSGVGVVHFIATGTAARPAGLVILTQPSGSARNGQALQRQPVIQVRDGTGNLKAGVIVTAQLTGGGGELLGTRQLGSDVNGTVAYTDLAIAAAEGPRRLVFTAAGFSGVTSDVIVVSTVPTSTVITSDSPDPSVAGGAVTVTVQVTAVGVVPLGTVTVTDGVESCEATLAGGTGGCQLPLSTVGNRTIRASYPGSAGLTGSSDTEAHRVDASLPPPPPQNQPPTAAFSAACNQLTCGFNSDGSGDSDGRIRSYGWNFGDGGSSDQRNPNHAYGSAGPYNVTLTVTDDDGASGSVTHQVTATPPPPPANKPPHAEFAVQCSDMTCAFQDRSTDDDGTIQGHSWSFGDGTSSTETNPSHTYTTAGKYNVSLVVTDNQGATDSREHDAEAKAPPPPPANKPPHAEFAVQCTDMTCAFQDRSTDDDGTIQGHSWSFGDGTSSTETNPSHTYTTAGKYKVTLVVTDNQGGTASRDHDVDAKAPPPASTTTTITSDTPEPSDPGQQITVSFTVTSGSGTPGGTVTISDANGGGCTGDAPSGSCSYTPNGTGNRTITATYGGNAGFQGSSDTEQHTVNEPPPNQAPTAAFAAPTCTTGEACGFTDGSSDPDGNVVAWNWDFGDGGNSSQQNPTHVYNTSGSYPVKLRVTDNDNDQSPEVQQTVTVNDPPPAAGSLIANGPPD